MAPPSRSSSISSVSAMDPFLRPPIHTPSPERLTEFPFERQPPSNPPAPSYSRLRTSASLSSLTDALEFVEKYVPAPPTRRSRTRYLLTAALGVLLLASVIVAGNSVGAVRRLKENKLGRLGTGDKGWIEWLNAVANAGDDGVIESR